MKAVRLHRYHEQPVVEDVPDPVVTGPLDVIANYTAFQQIRVTLGRAG
jgi:hypothetical protein